MADKQGNIYTYDYAHYISETSVLPTGIDFDNPVVGSTLDISAGYALVGQGVTNLDENPNAETSDTGYINQRSMSTTVDSYKFQFSGSAEVIAQDPALKTIMAVPYNVATGSEAERTVCVVNTHEAGVTDGTYKARLFRVSVAVSSMPKPATEKATLDFELNAVKDPVHGEYDVDTKTFTVIARPKV